MYENVYVNKKLHLHCAQATLSYTLHTVSHSLLWSTPEQGGIICMIVLLEYNADAFFLFTWTFT